jgi:hypothetical protein
MVAHSLGDPRRLLRHRERFRTPERSADFALRGAGLLHALWQRLLETLVEPLQTPEAGRSNQRKAPARLHPTSEGSALEWVGKTCLAAWS